MLAPATFTFLKNLAKHNDKAWFDANRAAYEAAKADHEALVTAVQTALTPLEPALEGQRPKDAIYRMYRDVRFSKDKTPYKTHMSSYYSRGGRKWEGAGYYLHVEPGKSFAGGGMWMPQGPLLKAVRQEIDYNHAELSAIINDKTFKKYFTKGITGEALKTVPQGYAADNPAIELLKQKSFVVTHPLPDEAFTTGAKGMKQIVAAFAAMKPLVDFMNRAMD